MTKLVSSPRFYYLRVIAFIVIAILVTHPVFAQSASQGKTLTPETLEKDSYRLWLACFQAWKQGKTPDVPNLGIFDSVDPKEAQHARAVWERSKFRAYLAVEEKSMYQTWLNFWQAQEQSKQTAVPILHFPDVFDEEQAKRIHALWEQAYTKAHLTVFEKGAYQTWLDYYQALSQGGQPSLPNLSIPDGVNLQESKQVQEVWQRSQARAQRKAQQSGQAQARQPKQPSVEADNIAALSEGKITSSLPNVVVDDETRQKAARTIIPIQDVTPQLSASSNQPKTIAAVFSFPANAPQPSIMRPNSPEAATANNNRIIADLNAETNKAKTTVNTDIAKKLIEQKDSREGRTNINTAVAGGSQLVRQYTYGSQLGPISMRQLINGQWVTSFFIYDGEGNVRALTDENGNVTDTYDYDAYGNLVNRTGNTPNNRLYHGEEWDTDLSMYYLRARYYQPATGRFFTQDSYEGELESPLSLHKYSYAYNNPINNTDFTGHFVDFGISSVLASIPTIFLQKAAESIKGQAQYLPPLRGDHLNKYKDAIYNTLIVTATLPKCDRALISYGLPSFFSLAARLFNENRAFDGTLSTAHVTFGKQQTVKDELDLFKRPPGAKSTLALTPNQKTDLDVDFDPPIVFLGNGFFGHDLDGRTYILLHELVHFAGSRSHTQFNGLKFTTPLNLLIGKPCFPAQLPGVALQPLS